MRRSDHTWNEPLLLSHTVIFVLSCLLLVAVSYQWGLNAAVSGYYSPEEQSRPVVTGASAYWSHRKSPSPWPASANAKHNDLMVEFSIPGNMVPFSEVFHKDFPWSPVEDVNFEKMELKELSDIQAGRNTREEVRMFIAVTTAVCSETSRKRRYAIRQTWMHEGLNLDTPVEVKFFVGNLVDCSSSMVQRMEKEMRDYDDIVVLRGDDSYNGLSNKTLGMMQYVLADPEIYTHMMKADDDVYARIPHVIGTVTNPPYGSYMQYVYKGCMANPNGFEMVRDPASKWYFSYDEISAETQKRIEGVGYAPGWSYLVSRDNVFHAMKKVHWWEHHPEDAPQWHKRMKGIEDAMVGILLSDRMDNPDYDARFKPTWKECTPDTVVVHLDVDSPNMLKPLYEQDMAGIWDAKSVYCSLGNFTPGDEHGWLAWRNSISKDGEKFI